MENVLAIFAGGSEGVGCVQWIQEHIFIIIGLTFAEAALLTDVLVLVVAIYYVDLILDIRALWFFWVQGHPIWLATNLAGILLGQIWSGHSMYHSEFIRLSVAQAFLLGCLLPCQLHIIYLAWRSWVIRKKHPLLTASKFGEAALEAVISSLVQTRAVVYEENMPFETAKSLYMSIGMSILSISTAFAFFDLSNTGIAGVHGKCQSIFDIRFVFVFLTRLAELSSRITTLALFQHAARPYGGWVLLFFDWVVVAIATRLQGGDLMYTVPNVFGLINPLLERHNSVSLSVRVYYLIRLVETVGMAGFAYCWYEFRQKKRWHSDFADDDLLLYSAVASTAALFTLLPIIRCCFKEELMFTLPLEAWGAEVFSEAAQRQLDRTLEYNWTWYENRVEENMQKILIPMQQFLELYHNSIRYDQKLETYLKKLGPSEEETFTGSCLSASYIRAVFFMSKNQPMQYAPKPMQESFYMFVYQAMENSIEDDLLHGEYVRQFIVTFAAIPTIRAACHTQNYDTDWADWLLKGLQGRRQNEVTTFASRATEIAPHLDLFVSQSREMSQLDSSDKIESLLRLCIILGTGTGFLAKPGELATGLHNFFWQCSDLHLISAVVQCLNCMAIAEKEVYAKHMKDLERNAEASLLGRMCILHEQLVKARGKATARITEASAGQPATEVTSASYHPLLDHDSSDAIDQEERRQRRKMALAELPGAPVPHDVPDILMALMARILMSWELQQPLGWRQQRHLRDVSAPYIKADVLPEDLDLHSMMKGHLEPAQAAVVLSALVATQAGSQADLEALQSQGVVLGAEALVFLVAYASKYAQVKLLRWLLEELKKFEEEHRPARPSTRTTESRESRRKKERPALQEESDESDDMGLDDSDSDGELYLDSDSSVDLTDFGRDQWAAMESLVDHVPHGSQHMNALSFAAQMDRVDIFDLLVQSKADPRASGRHSSALCEAVARAADKGGATTIVNYICDKVLPDELPPRQVKNGTFRFKDRDEDHVKFRLDGDDGITLSIDEEQETVKNGGLPRLGEEVPIGFNMGSCELLFNGTEIPVPVKMVKTVLRNMAELTEATSFMALPLEPDMSLAFVLSAERGFRNIVAKMWENDKYKMMMKSHLHFTLPIAMRRAAFCAKPDTLMQMMPYLKEEGIKVGELEVLRDIVKATIRGADAEQNEAKRVLVPLGLKSFVCKACLENFANFGLKNWAFQIQGRDSGVICGGCQQMLLRLSAKGDLTPARRRVLTVTLQRGQKEQLASHGLRESVKVKNDISAIVQIFLENGADPNEEVHKEHTCEGCGMQPIVGTRFLVKGRGEEEEEAKSHCVTCAGPSSQTQAPRGDTALSIAVEEDNAGILETLLKDGKGDPDTIVRDSPLLTIAMKRRSISIVRLLIQYKANINLPLKEGEKPLLLQAIENFSDNESHIIWLLRQSADPNSHFADSGLGEERDALYTAADKGLLRTCTELITCKANPNGHVKAGDNTPLLAAVKNGNDAIISLLLKQSGINLNAKDSKGTPIFLKVLTMPGKSEERDSMVQKILSAVDPIEVESYMVNILGNWRLEVLQSFMESGGNLAAQHGGRISVIEHLVAKEWTDKRQGECKLVLPKFFGEWMADILMLWPSGELWQKKGQLRNRAGAPMYPGQTHKMYCGRNLGMMAIPGSDGRCGPNNGPQCADCAAYDAETDAQSAVDTPIKEGLFRKVAEAISEDSGAKLTISIRPPSNEQFWDTEIHPEYIDYKAGSNKVVYKPGAPDHINATSKVAMTHGTHFFAMKVDSLGDEMWIGITNDKDMPPQKSLRNNDKAWTYYYKGALQLAQVGEGAKGAKSINQRPDGRSVEPYGPGDVIGVAVDISRKTVGFYKNGRLQGMYDKLPAGPFWAIVELDKDNDEIEFMTPAMQVDYSSPTTKPLTIPLDSRHFTQGIKAQLALQISSGKMVKDFSPPRTSRGTEGTTFQVSSVEVTPKKVILSVRANLSPDMELEPHNFVLHYGGDKTVDGASDDSTEFDYQVGGCKGTLIFEGSGNFNKQTEFALEIEPDDEDTVWPRITLPIRDARHLQSLSVFAVQADTSSKKSASAKVNWVQIANAPIVSTRAPSDDWDEAPTDDPDHEAVVYADANLFSNEVVVHRYRLRPCSKELRSLALAWGSKEVDEVEEPGHVAAPAERKLWLKSVRGWCDEEANNPMHWAAQVQNVGLAKLFKEADNSSQLLTEHNRKGEVPKDLARSKELQGIMDSGGEVKKKDPASGSRMSY